MGSKMKNFSIDQSDRLEGVKVLHPEMVFQEHRYAATDVGPDTDRWISTSMLIFALLPLGLWFWWKIISAIISVF